MLHGAQLQWERKDVDRLAAWPLHVTDGAIFYYKDKLEPVRTLTTEERAAIARVRFSQQTHLAPHAPVVYSDRFAGRVATA